MLEPLPSAVDNPLFVITANFESHTNSEVATAALQGCVGDTVCVSPILLWFTQELCSCCRHVSFTPVFWTIW